MNGELVRYDTSPLNVPGSVTATGLTLPEGLTYEQWLDVCVKLGMVTKASMWWWGDALNYGERTYGDKYTTALDESDYEYKTLRNAKWVAGKVPLSLRKDKLTFTHHAYVAGRKPEEIEQLLEMALAERLSAEELRRAVRRIRHTADPGPLPEGKFRVIYADPPWSYGDKLVDGYGAAEHHYETLTIDKLCAIDVESLALPDAVLFMWTTSPLLQECFAVITAWGFEYKSSFVWDKIKHNMGHYNSVRHELLLVCTRGSCLPDVPTLIDSVQSIERSERHSAKPDEFRKIIETLYPHGRRIELFQRQPCAGWTPWGNEVAA